MDTTNTRMQEMADQIAKLQAQLSDLSGAYYRNNFTSSQTFNKAVIFADRLRVPVFDSTPTVCEVGDLICVGGKLYICTVANSVWTIVGTQS